MIGIFHVFMWYFLLILYMGQIKGVFGTYEPITYKTGCSLWGVIFIIAGVSMIRAARHPTQGVKLGREVSRILLISYPLEFSIALAYSIFGCIGLSRHRNEDSLTTVTEEAESTF
uniref:Membrane spanning 4-domains A13 n=1 Tax=Ailuropoda melanoleuca TaxID=9646 RepID=A0A7N5P8F2_AILME